MKPVNVKTLCSFGIAIIALLSAPAQFVSAQTMVPEGIHRFPESLGPLADPGFYSQTSPMFSYTNWKNDASGNDKNIFILTLTKISNPFQIPNTYPTTKSLPPVAQKTYPKQAVILSATSTGVFPRWQLTFNDGPSTPTTKSFGLLRYHPSLGIYTVMNQDTKSDEDRGDLLILDSTFHQIDLLKSVILNTHDFQLLRMKNGNWEIITTLAATPTYFDSLDKNYQIANMVYDHSTFKGVLWTCGPTTQTVDSAEWYNICNRCDAHPNMMAQQNSKAVSNPNNYNSAYDMFHVNSMQSYSWSKDSLLVAVSEKNDDKIRFWWIVDSSDVWVTRDMFRLGGDYDNYNNFTLPDSLAFKINRGHNFRIVGRHDNTLIASYYDNEVCDTLLPARGLILELDIENKISRILQQVTQGSRSEGGGNLQVLLDKTYPLTPDIVKRANLCIDWGMCAPDNKRKGWEISVMNPNSQTIVGITVTDLGYSDHYMVPNNSTYQAKASYKLPIPSSPIIYTIKGDSVILTTKLVHPTWINGAKTQSIVLPIQKKGQPITTVWVRGKTDETMIGELWEHINLPSK